MVAYGQASSAKDATVRDDRPPHDPIRRKRHEVVAKNLVTTRVLALASCERVNPMRKLQIDPGEVMDAMYAHEDDVTSGLLAFPEQGIRGAMLAILAA
jgi:hypothetical protein